MNKEYDWFLMTVKNPNGTFLQADAAGYHPENTQFKDKEYYKNNEHIQQMFFDENGVFDEKSFDNAYQIAQIGYQAFATGQYNKDILKESVFDIDNIFAPVGSRKEQLDKFEVVAFNNPDRDSYGIEYIGSRTASPFSRLEIAQSLPVIDSKTGQSRGESPNELGFFRNWFSDPLVLATWDEKGTHTDPMTGLVVEHERGEAILNENGDYYYETLGDRRIADKTILTPFQVLTTDGIGADKINFLDDDDKDKSLFGAIMNNLVRVAPMFIPGVGPYYTALTIGMEMSKLFPVLYRSGLGLFSNDVDAKTPEFINKLEAFGKSFETQTSERGKENFFNGENLANMIGAIAAQLQQQRWLFKNAPRLFGHKSTKAIEEMSLQEYAKHYAKGAMDADIGAMKLTAAYKAEQLSTAALKARNKAGEILSRTYMAGTSGIQSYEEAKAEGASDFEAAMLSLGYMAGMYWLMGTEIGQWAIPESRAQEVATKKAIKNLVAQSAKAFQTTGSKEVTRKGLAKWFDAGKRLGAKALKPVSKGGSTIIANAIAESIEEVSEEALYDLTKTLMNMSTIFTGSETRLTAWDNMLDRYGAAAFGGLVGGALFSAANGDQFKMLASNDVKESVAIIASQLREDPDRVYKFVDKHFKNKNLGNKHLSATQQVMENGEVVYAEGTAKDNQQKALYDILINQIKVIDHIINDENLVISSNNVVNINALKHARYRDLIEHSGTATLIEKDFSDIITEVVQARAALHVAEHTLGNVKDAALRSGAVDTEQEAKINAAKLKLEEARQKRDDFLSGKNADYYLGLTQWRMTPALYSEYATLTFKQYVEEESGTTYDKVPRSKINEYRTQYEAYKTSPVSNDILKTAFDRFIQDNKNWSNILATHTTETDLSLQARQKYLNTKLQVKTSDTEPPKEITVKELISKLYDLAELPARLDSGAAVNTIQLATIFSLDESLSKLSGEEKIIEMMNQIIDQTVVTDDKGKKYLDKEVYDAVHATVTAVLHDFSNQQMNKLQQMGVNEATPIAYSLGVNTDVLIGALQTFNFQIENYYDPTAQNWLDYNQFATDFLTHYNQFYQEHIDEINIALQKREAELILAKAELRKVASAKGLQFTNLTELDASSNQDADYQAAYVHYVDLDHDVKTLKVNELDVNDTAAKSEIWNILSNLQYGAEESFKKLEKHLKINNKLAEVAPTEPTPIAAILAQNLGITKRNTSIFDIINEENAKLRQQGASQYIITLPSRELELQEANIILNKLKAIYTAALTVQQDDILFGFNNSVNHYQEQVGKPMEFGTIDHQTALMYLEEITNLQDRLRYIQRLSQLNTQGQLKVQKKTGVRLKHLQYKAIISNNPLKKLTIDGEEFWNEDIEDAIDEASTLAAFAAAQETEPNLELTDEQSDLIETELLKIEYAIYKRFNDLVKDGADMEAMFTEMLEEYGLINEKGENIFTLDKQENSDISVDTTQLNEYTQYFYLMSVLAGNPANFLESYSAALEQVDKIAPFPGQELVLRFFHSLYSNPELINTALKAMQLEKESVKTIGNLLFAEGIPGSGKTVAIAKLAYLMLNPKNESDVWLVTKNSEQLKRLQKAVDVNKKDNLLLVDDTATNSVLRRVVKDPALITHKYDTTNDYLYVDYSQVELIEDSNAPQLIIIDETTNLTNLQLQVLSDYAVKNGSIILALGDNEQIGYQGPDASIDIGNNLMASNLIDRLGMFKSPKLAVSMRISNSQKDTNINMVRSFNREAFNSADWKSQNVPDDTFAKIANMKLVYHEPEPGNLHGEKIVDQKSALDIFHHLRMLYNNKPDDDDAKIIHVFDEDFDESIQRKDELISLISEHNTRNPHDKLVVDVISFKELKSIQGDEALYFVIDTDWNKFFVDRTNLSVGEQNELSKNFTEALLTFISRSKKGSIIINNGLAGQTGRMMSPEHQDDTVQTGYKVTALAVLKEDRLASIKNILSKAGISSTYTPGKKATGGGGSGDSGIDVNELMRQLLGQNNEEAPHVSQFTKEDQAGLKMYTFNALRRGIVVNQHPTDPNRVIVKTSKRYGKNIGERIDDLNLFFRFDTDGNADVTKAEFEAAVRKLARLRSAILSHSPTNAAKAMTLGNMFEIPNLATEKDNKILQVEKVVPSLEFSHAKKNGTEKKDVFTEDDVEYDNHQVDPNKKNQHFKQQSGARIINLVYTLYGKNNKEIGKVTVARLYNKSTLDHEFTNSKVKYEDLPQAWKDVFRLVDKLDRIRQDTHQNAVDEPIVIPLDEDFNISDRRLTGIKLTKEDKNHQKIDNLNIPLDALKSRKDLIVSDPHIITNYDDTEEWFSKSLFGKAVVFVTNRLDLVDNDGNAVDSGNIKKYWESNLQENNPKRDDVKMVVLTPKGVTFGEWLAFVDADLNKTDSTPDENDNTNPIGNRYTAAKILYTLMTTYQNATDTTSDNYQKMYELLELLYKHKNIIRNRKTNQYEYDSKFEKLDAVAKKNAIDTWVNATLTNVTNAQSAKETLKQIKLIEGIESELPTEILDLKDENNRTFEAYQSENFRSYVFIRRGLHKFFYGLDKKGIVDPSKEDFLKYLNTLIVSDENSLFPNGIYYNPIFEKSEQSGHGRSQSRAYPAASAVEHFYVDAFVQSPDYMFSAEDLKAMEDELDKKLGTQPSAKQTGQPPVSPTYQLQPTYDAKKGLITFTTMETQTKKAKSVTINLKGVDLLKQLDLENLSLDVRYNQRTRDQYKMVVGNADYQVEITYNSTTEKSKFFVRNAQNINEEYVPPQASTSVVDVLTEFAKANPTDAVITQKFIQVFSDKQANDPVTYVTFRNNLLTSKKLAGDEYKALRANIEAAIKVEDKNNQSKPCK